MRIGGLALWSTLGIIQIVIAVGLLTLTVWLMVLGIRALNIYIRKNRPTPATEPPQPQP